MSVENRLVCFLVGPTATGKSAVALALARSAPLEVISCDSMQVYRQLSVLTSKPAPEERERVPHHLIDVVSCWQEFDVSQYRRLAVEAMRGVHARGRLPLFVGGTGLYMTVVLDGIFEVTTRDSGLRRKLIEQAEAAGAEAMHARLDAVDPQAALKIHPHDTRRIIRALEVFGTTGKPISRLQKERRGIADAYPVRVFGLRMPLPALYARIDARVEAMFDQGLIDEVKALQKKRLSKTAQAAIGVREVGGFLRGEYDEAEARRLMKLNTRHYARRQMTWFRKDTRVEWIDVTDNDSAQEIALRIQKGLAG